MSEPRLPQHERISGTAVPHKKGRSPREPVHVRRTDGPVHVSIILERVLQDLLLRRLRYQAAEAANAERARGRAA